MLHFASDPVSSSYELHFVVPRISHTVFWVTMGLMVLTLGLPHPPTVVAQLGTGVAAYPDVIKTHLDELDVDSAIPTCEAVLGFEWGVEIPNHQQSTQYFESLAAAAPQRCRWIRYGQSYEGRSLNYLIVSSAKNLATIDSIRQSNLQLADPRALSQSDAQAIIENAPAIVWLAYSVHGNEICPTEAAMLTAYHLLADQRETTTQILDNVVVIIDPLQNPDGRERFINVFRETRGKFVQSFPLANEHTERWPNGRTNHYWFDMNRDWFLQSQQETRNKVAAYLAWQPHLYIDAHEMGRNSSFFFPPPTDPKNPFLMPAQNDLLNAIGKHHAGWFDRYRFAYTTREMFDAFFPGYGSEWPSLQGGLGILWEQASPRGLLIDRDDETQLSYADGVRNLYVSALATLDYAAQHQTELLRQFFDNRYRSVRLGKDGDVTDFFLVTKDRPQRTQRLVETLQRNGIEVRRLVKSLSLVGNSSHDRALKERSIPAGSYHIPVAQPTGALIRALLDREVPMDQQFLERQLERNKLRLRDEIYDVTAWSLPLAFDIHCLSAKTTMAIDSSPLTFDRVAANGMNDFETVESASDNVNTTAVGNEQFSNFEKAQVAYLIPGTDGAMQMLASLVRDGFRLHVTDQPFKLNQREFPRGTLIVKVAENDANLHSRLQTDAARFEVEVVPTDTSFVDEGAHFGGPHVHWVKPAKILLVVNQPTGYSSGHTWHLFDEVLEYPTTRVNGESFGQVDLSKFNTIIIPDGNYSGRNGFSEETAKNLQTWVARGGTLILIAGATRWAAAENNPLLANSLVRRKIEPEPSEDDEKAKPERVTPDAVPGAFFQADIFQKHWLTFHTPAQMPLFYSGSLVLSPTGETAGRTIAQFRSDDQLLASGFCWPASLQLLKKTPAVVYRSTGQGHVVSFTVDPNYRGMYVGIQRIFINAAMFGAGH